MLRHAVLRMLLARCCCFAAAAVARGRLALYYGTASMPIQRDGDERHSLRCHAMRESRQKSAAAYRYESAMKAARARHHMVLILRAAAATLLMLP